MRLVSYQKDYYDVLDEMLHKFSEEIFGEGTSDTPSFIDNHWAIYLVVKDSEVIGFTSFFLNTYYGLRPLSLGNDYLYVLPEYRKGRALYLLSIQIGKVCVEANLPMEHYYCSEESKKISRKLSGTKMYEAYLYEVEEVERVFNNLTTKIKIKE